MATAIPHLVFPARHEPRVRRSWQSFGLAITIEVLAIATVVAWIVAHSPQPVPQVMPITIESMQPEPAPALPAPEAPKSLPLPQARPIMPPRPAPRPVPQPEALPPMPAQEIPVTPPPMVSAPTAFSAPPVIAAAPPAPPPPPPVQLGPPAEYIAKVKAAVQAAAVYPPAAVALNFRGRTRVEFKLKDGVSSQARVVTGSGMGLVDRAALQSVQAALYPPSPAVLAGKEEIYQVWVEFNF